MKKLSLTAILLTLLALTGCTVTNQNKNLMKEPNGNIRVETATIKRFVPVSFTYQTNVTSCSEVEFLRYVTEKDPTLDNIYEIHWNLIENHHKFLGVIKTEKKYSCNFWGVGVEYGDPLPRVVPTGTAVVTASGETVTPEPATPAVPVAAAMPAVAPVSAPAVAPAEEPMTAAKQEVAAEVAKDTPETAADTTSAKH